MNKLIDRGMLEPPELGCLLCLPGLPGSGSYIQDRSPYEKGGTLIGATWNRSSGGVWCLCYDGVDDKAGLEGIWSLSGSITVELWAKVDRTNVRYTLFHSEGGLGFEVNNPGGGDNPGAVGVIQPGISLQARTADNVMDTNWHHAAYIKRGAGATNEIYVDSCCKPLVANYSWNLNLTGANWLGARDGSSQYLKGALALVRIYNRALSQLEIRRHFNQEKHLFGAW